MDLVDEGRLRIDRAQHAAQVGQVSSLERLERAGDGVHARAGEVEVGRVNGAGKPVAVHRGQPLTTWRSNVVRSRSTGSQARRALSKPVPIRFHAYVSPLYS